MNDIDPDAIDEWRQLLGEGRCLCSSANTDWAALDDLLDNLAAATAERDEARAAVERVRVTLNVWRVEADDDERWLNGNRVSTSEAQELPALIRQARTHIREMTAALGHVPTTEGGEG